MSWPNLQAPGPGAAGHGGLPAVAGPERQELLPGPRPPHGLAGGIPLHRAGGPGQWGGQTTRNQVKYSNLYCKYGKEKY